MIALIVGPEAQADIEAVKGWYDGEQAGLGVASVGELDATLARVRALPLQFPEVRGGVRRALLHRFPHAVYFVLRTPDAGAVIAVLHQHQRPAIWLARARREKRIG